MSDNHRDHASRASVQKSTVAIVLAGLLLAGYAGLYYATVRAFLYASSPTLPPPRGLSPWSGSYGLIEISPEYAALPSWLPQRVARFIFAPMHAIDRRIRPGFWELPMLPAAIPVAPPPSAAPGSYGPSLAP
jgi:hypothetical protein